MNTLDMILFMLKKKVNQNKKENTIVSQFKVTHIFKNHNKSQGNDTPRYVYTHHIHRGERLKMNE